VKKESEGIQRRGMSPFGREKGERRDSKERNESLWS